MATSRRLQLRPRPLAAADARESDTRQDDATAQHIRGSSLLLGGRFVAYGMEFATQVLLVRYLSVSDFGALSYALAIMLIFKSVAILELPNTLARFIPLYRERKQYGHLIGSIALATGTIAVLGGLMAASLYLGVGEHGLKPADDPQALALLVAISLLIPVEGLDALMTAVFATLAGARQIAFRQILAPALKLGAVAVLVFWKGDVLLIAGAYVIASAVSLLIYARLLWPVALEQLRRWQWRAIKIAFPFRDVFGFALPLLASTLVWLLMESSDAVLLGMYQGTEAVASFRAVLPFPRVLATLTVTFAILYTPVAARLYATSQHEAIANLYRRVALWMTVLCFPVFILAFSFSQSTTAGVYGARYSDSAPVMALLSLGYYCFAVTGFNGLTLKIYKKLRYAVGVDIAAAMLNLAVNLVLIPRFGAVGAAVGTAGTMVVHNALKQYGLHRYLNVSLFAKGYLAVYSTIFIIAIALLGLETMSPMSLWAAVAIAAGASLFVLWVSRHLLSVDEVFPELRRSGFAAGIFRLLLR